MKQTPSSSSCGPVCALTKPRWNPYIVGALIGVLSWIAFGYVGKGIGMSTQVAASSCVLAAPLAGDGGIEAMSYYQKTPFKWDYSMAFLVGTFCGALGGALISGSFRPEVVPAVWREHFGSSPVKRLIAAFLGGIIILFGARLANGCTSGHGITGSLQLAVSSWTFFLVMFASGIITALILFRRRSSQS